MTGQPPVLDTLELRVQQALQEGLPITAQPYRQLAEEFGASEQQVIAIIEQLLDGGTIKRFGMVLRHRQLGYQANAMVVWDVPDHEVQVVGNALGAQACVTLSYRRPRRPPLWNYNLFCMIHGKSRQRVLEQLQELVERLQLDDYPHQVLFSNLCFKQRGAVYV
jgi:DNA-binding Lrp family transcriptional regulator